MQTFKLIQVALFSIFFSSGLYAQTTTQKIDRTTSDVQQINNGINVLKDIFKKKKDNASQSTNVKNEEKNSDIGNNSLPKSDRRKLKPGDVSPNAKYLDVDEIGRFSGGAAIVRKGESSALIDSAGNLIIPFNKYVLTTHVGAIFAGDEYIIEKKGVYDGGIFAFYDDYWDGNIIGFVNSKGEVVYQRSKDLKDETCKLYADGTITITRKEMKKTPGYILPVYHVTVIPPSGARKTFTNGSTNSLTEEAYNAGCFLTATKDGSGYEFVDLNGKKLFEGILGVDSHVFSEGLALVSKVDDYGQSKFGFIDRRGKTIIPFKYSFPPSDFHNGRSLVRPKDQSEFAYCYINKTGNIVFKMTLADSRQKFGNFGEFQNGLAYSDFGMFGSFALDTTGKIYSRDDIAKITGYVGSIISVSGTGNHHTGPSKAYLVLTFSGHDPVTKRTGYGLINLVDSTYIAPFADSPLSFDFVSGLSYARMNLGLNKTTGKVEFREGYVNRYGIFVMLKGPGSKW